MSNGVHAMADHARLERIENKLDKLAEGFATLARLDERMITLFRRNDAVDVQLTRIQDRLAEVERATIGRGIFFRWIDRVGLALVGAAAAVIISSLTGG